MADIPRGYRKLKLLVAMAHSGLSDQELADEYEYAVATVTQYRRHYRDEINLLRENRDDKLEGLWAAKREARIAEYQQSIEDIDEVLARSNREDKDNGPLLKLKHQALRNIAEELGLPNRITITPDSAISVRYVAEGAEGLK